MTCSIRRRLLILLLSVIGSVWGLVTWRVCIETQHRIEELLDINLAQSAQVLLELFKHEQEHEGNQGEKFHLTNPLPKSLSKNSLAFLIRTHDGQVMVRFPTTVPIFPGPNKELAEYFDYQANDHLWRVFTLEEKQFIVQIGERYETRDELIGKIIVSGPLTALLLALPLLALLIWVSVGRSFRPLQQVATEIAARAPDQLQPLDTKKIPLEIKTLVNALNHLFVRLDRAFENERRFTADAAHELRTPLAGLKTQAQVAQRATDPQKRQQALQQILTGVDRATRLVTQLLTLARMDATQDIPTSLVDIHELVSQTLIDLTPYALDKAIDLGLETTAKFSTTPGNPDALRLMFCNFVDNAICYTPTHGQVTVFLENRQASHLTVTVKDTGPGIPVEQQGRIFERFYRGENHGIPGSGLGLSIAQRVAKLHHLEIQLENEPNGSGLRVWVDLPLWNHQAEL